MSPLTVTIADLRKHLACRLEERVAVLENHLDRNIPEDEGVPLRTWAEITPNPVELAWALRACWSTGGREVGVEVSCRAAERSLVHVAPAHLEVCRAAIAAARGYVRGEVSLDELHKAHLSVYQVQRAEVVREALLANTAYYAPAFALDKALDHAGFWSGAGLAETDAQRADLLELLAVEE